jgi:Fic family protein
LNRWNPLFAFLPVETVIHDRQAEYYRVLGACDKVGNSTAFIEFLLAALLTALREVSAADQVSDQVSDQVKSLLKLLKTKPLSAMECMTRLKLSHRPTFRANYLNPALHQGLIERTIPEKPNSRLQKYRLSGKD